MCEIFNNTNILIFYDKFLTSQITNPQIAHNYDRVRRREKKMAGVETNKRQLGPWSLFTGPGKWRWIDTIR